MTALFLVLRKLSVQLYLYIQLSQTSNKCTDAGALASDFTYISHKSDFRFYMGTVIL